jgi:hypothetical protein
MQKLNKLFFLSFLLMPAISFCQDFSHSAKVDSITESGFYSLAIKPELSAYLDASLKDLRITDKRGRPVPYIINTLLPQLQPERFPFLPILKNSIKDSGRSHLVLENTTKRPVEGLALIIGNASVSRTASISGSNDGETWFTILENFNLTGGEFSDSTRFVLTFWIPKSSYKYFKLLINNLNNDPLNIVAAGSYSPAEFRKWQMLSSTSELLAFNNPSPEFIQTDSADKYSYIRVIQQYPYHIDHIGIHLKNPLYYLRKMQVIIGNRDYDFILNGNGNYTLPRFAAKEFMIKIFNGDNPPRPITEVITSQVKKEVVAYLEAGEEYSLLMGNPKIEAPKYDLEHFRDSISNIKPLSYQAIQPSIKTIVKEKKGSNTSLWLIIIVVLGVLSFFTWNLTRELKKSKN